MASEPDVTEISSLFERFERNRDPSLFIPFLLALTGPNPSTNPENPDQQNEERPNPRDRIILINPFTQGMLVIEGSPSLDSLFSELGRKDGQPPASKSSIEAMPSLEIREEGSECVICLEDMEVGELGKEMPCKHKFHGACIEKWLGLHGSCPVCRYMMPFDEEGLAKKVEGGERERRREREIWVSFSFNGSGRRNGDSHQPPSDSSDDSS